MNLVILIEPLGCDAELKTTPQQKIRLQLLARHQRKSQRREELREDHYLAQDRLLGRLGRTRGTVMKGQLIMVKGTCISTIGRTRPAATAKLFKSSASGIRFSTERILEHIEHIEGYFRKFFPYARTRGFVGFALQCAQCAPEVD